MPYLLLLALAASLAAAESAPHAPVSAAGWRLGVALVGMLGVVLFAAGSAGIVAKGLNQDFSRREFHLARFSRLTSAHMALWLVVAITTSLGLGWGQLVRFNWHLDDTFLLDQLLIVLPVLLPLVASWLVFYEVERTVEMQCAQQTGTPPKFAGRLGYVASQFRHQIAIVLIPLAALVCFDDLARWISPRFGWMLLVPLAAALTFFFPDLLRWLWQCAPLPDSDLQRRTRHQCATGHVDVRGVLVWNVSAVNAAVAGFWPSRRFVFVTQGALAHFDDDEMDAALAHEIGHLRNRHLTIRAFAALAPLAILAVVGWGFVPPRGLEGAAAMLGQFWIWPTYVLYLFAGFGRLCRGLEFDADRYACCDPETGLVSSARCKAFEKALMKLCRLNGINPRRGGWLHPSMLRRLAAVRNWSNAA